MRSPSLRAARPLLALAAGFAGLLSHSAQAQSDPFALPKTLTVDSAQSIETGPLLSEIVVDGRQKSRMVTIEGKGDNATIDAEEARAAGLPVPSGAKGQIALASLKLYQWKYDSFRQRLTVALFRQNDGPNFRDLSARNYGPSESTPLLAVRLDYDLTTAITPREVTAGGLFDAALVRGNLSFSTSARILGSTGDGGVKATRLDSRLEYLWDRKGLVATAGDFTSAGSHSQRPVRMAGLKLGTDFDLRPDLVGLPLPAFSGTVAVPTTIDIVNADRSREVAKLEPGDFTVQNIPAPLGRGQVTAVLRDALGRETIQTARFYVSRDLLAPGRSAYAVNAGFVRRRYGLASADYGPAATSLYYRRGLSPGLTVEASGEWTAGLVNVGARADFVIAKLAKATFEGRFSDDADAGSGRLVNFGFESIATKLGLIAGATLPGATYRDVASRLGDPTPPKRLFANAFYRPTDDIRMQVGVVRSEERADPRFARQARRIDSAVASVQAEVFGGARAILAANYRKANGVAERSVSAGLSFSFGGRNRVAAQAKYGTNDRSGGIYFSRDEEREGDIGYGFSARTDQGDQSINGRVGWRGRMMQLDGEAEWVSGRPAVRANARGSLLLAGGQIYARNRSQTGFALVQTGTVADVPITLENRFVGKTNAKGRLLVQDIAPRLPVRIDVDDKQLPRDALVRETKHVIRVPQRAVALVEINAIRFVPVMRVLVDSAGNALSPGLPVRAQPSGEVSLTGFDGYAEINAGAGDRRLIVGTPGSGCVVDLTGVDLEAGDGPLVCVPSTIAADDIEPRTVAKRNGRKPARAARGLSPADPPRATVLAATSP
ncbi:Fimbrial Usher protein [Tsuneonella dongtanensis]|uniref:Fimbrial Usher protein n=1 Tax=Tsuneonella dongtanensis TaxID=692370 RepID=A0A1B2AA45_9SPHN|nr:fimbria/pilus outer membrane usher protein [Tsuneonella dongtanensis]ANY19002.1 Fimbrial Usher protein [Tsuneonella dongtanensis]